MKAPATVCKSQLSDDARALQDFKEFSWPRKLREASNKDILMER